MSRVRYRTIKWQVAKQALIDPIHEAIESYRSQGFRPNPRGVAYRLEGGGVIRKTDKNFQLVEDIVKEGREIGEFDWDDIVVDSARDLRDYATWDSEAERIKSAAETHLNDKWATQPRRVEVWMEKEGLLGVLGPICEANDVPYRALTGHDAIGAKREAARRIMDRWAIGRTLAWFHDVTGEAEGINVGWLRRYMDRDPATFKTDAARDLQRRTIARYEIEKLGPNQDTVILYVGDHDPSGMDVERDFTAKVAFFGADTLFEVIRVGVTCRETCQMIAAGLTPAIHSNPAKQTDGRFEGYLDTHFGQYPYEVVKTRVGGKLKKTYLVVDEDGDPVDVQSWEVEAIDPADLAQRVGDAIEQYRDEALWRAALEVEAGQTENLTLVADNWDDALGAVA